ncbi:hypothetical protein ABN028_15840 [Actinopolymorpha sp. B17G11]
MPVPGTRDLLSVVICVPGGRRPGARVAAAVGGAQEDAGVNLGAGQF